MGLSVTLSMTGGLFSMSTLSLPIPVSPSPSVAVAVQVTVCPLSAPVPVRSRMSPVPEVAPPVPDLVVYLQAPVDTLLFRIARRGVGYEQRIGRHYLERLNEAYAKFFHAYAASPLLIVNAATIDPIHNEQHYEVLLEEICRIRSGRHFFNPVVSVRWTTADCLTSYGAIRRCCP